MNAKRDDKQNSDDRTSEEQTSDENKFLTNCLAVSIDEIFRLRKISSIETASGV